MLLCFIVLHFGALQGNVRFNVLGGGAVTIPDRFVRHKYNDLVKVEVSLRPIRECHSPAQVHTACRLWHRGGLPYPTYPRPRADDVLIWMMWQLAWILWRSYSHADRRGLHQLHTCRLITPLPLHPPPAGIGTYSGLTLAFSRQDPEPLMLVTDRAGRIRHITSSLAALLDSSVEALQVRDGYWEPGSICWGGTIAV